MDKPINNDTRRSQKTKKVLRYALLAVLFVLAVWGVRQLLRTQIDAASFQTAVVERGDIENTITASGVVTAAFEEQLNAPVTTQIKEVLLTAGANVKPGDRILELNQTLIKLEYGGLRDKLELRRNNITKLNFEFDKNINELEFDSQIKGLQIAGYEAALADATRLQEIGGATTEETEQAKLQLDIARLEKKKLENELQYRQSVVQSDRDNLKLELQIAEKELNRLGQKLSQTTVTAPRAGVITWVNESIGQQVNEGDPLVRIADLDRFRIEARASDRYSEDISAGMPVRIRIGDRRTTGTIASVSPAVENNTVEFLVTLNEADADYLKPSMRVDVYLVTDRKENVLRVKNGNAFRGAAAQYIFKKEGDRAVRKSIEVGLTNRDFAEILPGELKEGDRIIISDTKDLEHLAEIDF